MAERDRFELDLAAAVRAYLENAPTQVRPSELARQFATAYPHRRTALGRWGLSGRRRRAPGSCSCWLALLVVLVGGMLVVGSQLGAQAPGRGAARRAGGHVSTRVDARRAGAGRPGPPARRNKRSAAFDRRAGRLVVFTNAGDPVETWTFDVCTNTWTRKHPNREPPADFGTTRLRRRLLSDDRGRPATPCGPTTSRATPGPGRGPHRRRRGSGPTTPTPASSSPSDETLRSHARRCGPTRSRPTGPRSTWGTPVPSRRARLRRLRRPVGLVRRTGPVAAPRTRRGSSTSAGAPGGGPPPRGRRVVCAGPWDGPRDRVRRGGRADPVLRRRPNERLRRGSGPLGVLAEEKIPRPGPPHAPGGVRLGEPAARRLGRGWNDLQEGAVAALDLMNGSGGSCSSRAEGLPRHPSRRPAPTSARTAAPSGGPEEPGPTAPVPTASPTSTPKPTPTP